MTEKEAQLILIESYLHSEETRIDFYLSKSKELEIRQTSLAIALRKAFNQIRLYLTTPDTESWGVDELTGKRIPIYPWLNLFSFTNGKMSGDVSLEILDEINPQLILFQEIADENELKGFTKLMEIKANINFENNLKKCNNAEELRVQLNQEWKYRLNLIGNKPSTIEWFEKYKNRYRPNSGDAYIDNILSHTMELWYDEQIEQVIQYPQKKILSKSDKVKVTYNWQGDRITELKLLYKLMKGHYITNDTKFNQFKAIFSEQPISEKLIPIKWHDDNVSELIYFIHKLEITNELIKLNSRTDYKRMTSCFVTFEGKKFEGQFKSLKNKIEYNLSDAKQDAINSLIINNFT